MVNLTLDSGELLTIAAIDYRGDDLEAKLQYRKPNKDGKGLSHVQTCFLVIDKQYNLVWGWQNSPFNKAEIQNNFNDMIASEKANIEQQFAEYFGKTVTSRLLRRNFRR